MQCKVRQVPCFKRGLLLLHTNKQGTNPQRASTTNGQNTEGHKHRDRETHAVSKDTQPKQTKNRPRTTQTTKNIEATKPVHQTHRTKSPHHDRPSSRLQTTHHDAQAPHVTTVPSSLSAKPSEPSGLQPARHDTKDSTKQRRRGNVAHGKTNRPQQSKIHNNGTDTQPGVQTDQESVDAQSKKTQHLPSTANRHRSKDQTANSL